MAAAGINICLFSVNAGPANGDRQMDSMKVCSDEYFEGSLMSYFQKQQCILKLGVL